MEGFWDGAVDGFTVGLVGSRVGFMVGRGLGGSVVWRVGRAVGSGVGTGDGNGLGLMETLIGKIETESKIIIHLIFPMLLFDKSISVFSCRPIVIMKQSRIEALYHC